MLVFIAHNGRTVQLDVQPTTRVSAMQQVLASLTGIPAEQHILMCEGRRLEGATPLAAYKLPWEGQGKQRDVFLYCRAHLRPGVHPPAPDALPPVHVDVPPADAIEYDNALLQLSPSPLYRALVDYERTFRHHVAEAEAYAAASAARSSHAAALLAEQRVQQAAMEAAVVNVEGHYRYIRDLYSDFVARYSAQAARQTAALERFSRELDTLAAAPLHARACTDQFRCLADLVQTDKLAAWAEYCRKSHVQFADKVHELERLYNTLRADVEALLLAAPAMPGLEQLAAQERGMRAAGEEQATLVNALRGDFRCVQSKVEDSARLVAAAAPGAAGLGPGASGVDLEELRGMEEMNCVHQADMLPRVREAFAALDDYAHQCARGKAAMTAHLFEQLQCISGQQSKIRDMRNKLSAFKEVGSRQADAFAQLELLRQVPLAYVQCLAECVRRRAWAELYTNHARQLAERMGRIRDKEQAKRDAFAKQVERLVPSALLASMGLLVQPPHCQVHLPEPGGAPIEVSVEELQRAADAVPGGADSRALATLPEREEGGGEEEEEGADGGRAALELENARLRAELAQRIAQQAASCGGSGGASPQASAHGGGGGGGAAAGLSGGSSGAWAEALASKEAYIAALQSQLSEARGRAAAYERRISALEALQAGTRGDDPPSLHASGQLPPPPALLASGVSASGDSLAASMLLRPPPPAPAATAAAPRPAAGQGVAAADGGYGGNDAVASTDPVPGPASETVAAAAGSSTTAESGASSASTTVAKEAGTRAAVLPPPSALPGGKEEQPAAEGGVPAGAAAAAAAGLAAAVPAVLDEGGGVAAAVAVGEEGSGVASATTAGQLPAAGDVAAAGSEGSDVSIDPLGVVRLACAPEERPTAGQEAAHGGEAAGSGDGGAAAAAGGAAAGTDGVGAGKGEVGVGIEAARGGGGARGGALEAFASALDGAGLGGVAAVEPVEPLAVAAGGEAGPEACDAGAEEGAGRGTGPEACDAGAEEGAGRRAGLEACDAGAEEGAGQEEEEEGPEACDADAAAEEEGVGVGTEACEAVRAPLVGGEEGSRSA